MRRSLLVLLLVPTVGCLSFHEVPGPQSPGIGELPGTLRVTRMDGTQQMLGNARLVGDTIHGIWPTSATRFAVPVSEVARIEVKRIDPWRTALFASVVLGTWIWVELMLRPEVVNQCAGLLGSGGVGVLSAPCPLP